ncbi:MAG: hypothetical protein KDI46_03320 [Alphaproteobacteria bacterium]|nr:hypothetical protein [Alphaproteobacteria bacterium]
MDHVYITPEMIEILQEDFDKAHSRDRAVIVQALATAELSNRVNELRAFLEEAGELLDRVSKDVPESDMPQGGSPA